MTFDTRNQEWGSHIVSADAPTQKLNYCSRASLRRVINSVVDVRAPRMIFENAVWHMEAQRTQHCITMAAAHIRFFCFFLWQDKFSYPLSPSPRCLFSFSHSRAGSVEVEDGGGEREDRGRQGNFLSVWKCGIIICFFSGCCSEAAGWRTPPAAAPNRHRERDAWLKNPMKVLTYRHTIHTHRHSLVSAPHERKHIYFNVRKETLN